jgi:hypothetical protein
MRFAPIFLVGFFLMALTVAVLPSSGRAQEGPGGSVNPGRDCQTLLTCRYSKGGSYRGCLSSYSCRVCQFVPARCQIGGRGRNCRELRCNWGV